MNNEATEGKSGLSGLYWYRFYRDEGLRRYASGEAKILPTTDPELISDTLAEALKYLQYTSMAGDAGEILELHRLANLATRRPDFLALSGAGVVYDAIYEKYSSLLEQSQNSQK